ncbi:Protein-disulfide isomerase [Quadrisphaera granulorum]|uniref:Protein-disulfide isomerase n=1 Tax=Quadrisphaera granulorum TaxID=317664 RepID=A0A316A4A4_9ACTN|nr:thioredoxin domain-containing protein [Quadrisphaera granulorum]PWJ52721.1 protein-disulfide isomerase [Quadrisphaera granulorum]SZE97543.1 Protein-disulfide isomerase [Quadrisphaera granulorum]
MPDRPTTKDARREAAREKARQLREAEARKKRRNRVLAISAAAVALVLVIGVAAIVITRATADKPVVQPPGVTGDGGIVLGNASAPHTVTIFEDYQCPACKAYEPTVVPWLDQQVQAGTIKLEFRPLIFLDRRFGGDYSLRAANAAFCLAGQSGVDFVKFNEAMYEAQPEEGTGGLTDSKIVSIAQGAGGDIGTCIAAGTYEGFAQKVDAAAFALTDAQGAKVVSGTPTVLVDGKLLTGDGGQGVPSQQQIAAAVGITG